MPGLNMKHNWKDNVWNSSCFSIPKRFRNRKVEAKSRTLWLQSCFIHIIILNMNRGSLHTRRFRVIHLSVSRYRYRWTQNGFTGRKSFRSFWETDPRPFTRTETSLKWKIWVLCWWVQLKIGYFGLMNLLPFSFQFLICRIIWSRDYTSVPPDGEGWGCWDTLNGLLYQRARAY